VAIILSDHHDDHGHDADGSHPCPDAHALQLDADDGEEDDGDDTAHCSERKGDIPAHLAALGQAADEREQGPLRRRCSSPNMLRRSAAAKREFKPNSETQHLAIPFFGHPGCGLLSMP